MNGVPKSNLESRDRPTGVPEPNGQRRAGAALARD